MKILVIGAKGQLGWELCEKGLKAGFDIVPLGSEQLDITDSKNVHYHVSDIRPVLVINAAAYTAVDKAELEPEKAFLVNNQGPANLADACKKQGIPLIHISTDYVFNGKNKNPYLETDPVSPLGIYGKSKAQGENEVRERLREHIIIRTAWLYGVKGKNFVKTILNLAKDRESIKVVADQYGCPTYASDLAQAILAIASSFKKGQDIIWGTYHFTGVGVTAWHGFAQEIVRIAKLHVQLAVKNVEPIPTSEFPTPVQRPANSSLDCSLLAKNFGINPRPWKTSLQDMLESFYTSLNL